MPNLTHLPIRGTLHFYWQDTGRILVKRDSGIKRMDAPLSPLRCLALLDVHMDE